MSKILVLLIGLLSLNIIKLNAQDYPESMTFSYVNHPVIVNKVIPLIEKTYLKLDIKTRFILQPSLRNLKAVNNELVDGDVAYSDLLLKGYDELIKIRPKLMDSVFVLLCKPSIVCNQQVLFDSKQTFAATDSSKSGLDIWFDNTLSASFYAINDLSVIPKLISENRVQYGVYVLGKDQQVPFDVQKLNLAPLFTTSTFHTVHKKYAFMKDEIGQALAISMQEMANEIKPAN
ncbi:hypothetical protein [Paraglaciecola sp.]|uniref:hypothetical protein n=1 Tax=Paraglaciecola sp. TaxID=1920173 RepID=UPI003EF2E15A